MVVQEAPQTVRAPQGKGEKSTEEIDLFKKKKKRQAQEKVKSPSLSFGKLALKRQCESLEENYKLPPNPASGIHKNHKDFSSLTCIYPSFQVWVL